MAVAAAAIAYPLYSIAGSSQLQHTCKSDSHMVEDYKSGFKKKKKKKRQLIPITSWPSSANQAIQQLRNLLVALTMLPQIMGKMRPQSLTSLILKCNKRRCAGLGNRPNASSACTMSPGMDTLPFVDISLQHLVSSLFILHLAYFVLDQRLVHKYRCTRLVKSKQSRPGHSHGVPLFPFIFASLAATCSNERAGHIGHPLSLSTRCHHSFLLSHSTTLFILSLSQAQIFVSVLGNLPPLNSVRRRACFMLSQLCDEIHCNCLERQARGAGDRKGGWLCQVCVNFVHLTDYATFNIVGYKVLHAQLPVIRLNELDGFGNPRVASSF